MVKTLKYEIVLNGTDTNPYAAMGLRQNPFPQLGISEYEAGERRLQALGAEPIPHDRYAEYIREKLKGFGDELIDLCIAKFKPGERVKFTIEFPE